MVLRYEVTLGLGMHAMIMLTYVDSQFEDNTQLAVSGYTIHST